MAFEGAISFLEPKGGEVAWNEKDVQLPLANRAQSSWLKTSNLHHSNHIYAKGFQFAIPENTATDDRYVCYDDPQRSTTNETTFVVIIGSEKQAANKDVRKHYVIFVAKRTDANGVASYERVGVGHLLGKFIDFQAGISIPID